MTDNVPDRPIRKVPLLLAPFQALLLDIGGMLAHPLAFFGGLTMAGIAAGGGFAYVMLGHSNSAEAAEDEELQLEFMPGQLARLGKKYDPKDIPQKLIADETRAVDNQVTPTTNKVTKDETPSTETKKEKDVKPTDKPSKKSNKTTGKAGTVDSQGNNTHNELPTVDQLPGDPFGDPNGWADMTTAGDPWATSVLAALNGMKVGAFGAKADGAGAFKFKLKICKDGKIDQVMQKQGSGKADFDASIKAELARLVIPKPPANVLKAMKSPCVTLNYVFVWQAGRVN